MLQFSPVWVDVGHVHWQTEGSRDKLHCLQKPVCGPTFLCFFYPPRSCLPSQQVVWDAYAEGGPIPTGTCALPPAPPQPPAPPVTFTLNITGEGGGCVMSQVKGVDCVMQIHVLLMRSAYALPLAIHSWPHIQLSVSVSVGSHLTLSGQVP